MIFDFGKEIMLGSYLVFPFLAVMFFLFLKKKLSLPFFVVCALLSTLFIKARFIEPFNMTTNVEEYSFVSVDSREEESDEENKIVKVAFFADSHIGVYRNARELKKEVQKINSFEPDIILIAGDFIHEIEEDKMEESFAAFSDFTAPAYAVAGNHDSEQPGEISSAKVREAIEKSGVEFIDNEMNVLEFESLEIKLLGWSDIWEGEFDIELIDEVKEEDNSILLVHNPDAAYYLPEDHNIDLVLSGHTHCGQIRVPYFYKFAIPTDYPFDCGWYKANNADVYITAGTGMTGLPLRFLNPPVVELLEIRLK